MDTTIDYRPAHIEFLGTPGSGKTTLLAALTDFLRERQFQPYTVIEAARPFALRTWPGRVINRLVPKPLRKPLLWQVFYFHSFISRMRFVKENSALIRQVTSYQRQRDKLAGSRERGVLFWFYRLSGYYEFLRPRIRNSEILLFDDGFVHRVVHLFASEVEIPDRDQIASYLELIPKPDLVIIPTTPLEICEQRVFNRGIWKHSQHKTPEQIRSYLSNAEQVVQITAEFLQNRGWPVLFLDNGERNINHAAQEMYRQLNNLELFLQNPSKFRGYASSGTQAGKFFHIHRPSRLWGIVRSRQRPLDIDLQTIDQVLKSYDLRRTGHPENLPLSKRTQNVLIPTQKGKKVLKRYRPMLPLETIEYSHSILEELARINYPSIRLVENQSGLNLGAYNGSHYSISTFVEGDSYSSSFLLRSQRCQVMALAGKNLAQFHRALRNFIPSGRHHLGFNTASGEWQRGVDWYTEESQKMKHKSRQSEYNHDKDHLDWLVQNFESILTELTKLDSILRLAPLPRLIIHGDYGLHNLVFPKDGFVTMLDFETARLEWRLSDLVSALSRLRFRDGSYDLEVISSFMKAYHKEYPIEREEWGWLPTVWRFYKLRSALIYWNSYLDTAGPRRKLISAKDAVWQANWVIQHPEKLIHLIPEYRQVK